MVFTSPTFLRKIKGKEGEKRNRKGIEGKGSEGKEKRGEGRIVMMIFMIMIIITKTGI